MKFSIDREPLLAALQTAANAVPNKSTLQILNNFLFRLEGNILEITATDLDMGIRHRLEVQGETDGAVVVNARKLLDIIKAMDNDLIQVSVDDYLVLLRNSASLEFRITGFDAMEFPALPDIEEGHNFEFNSSELQFLCDKTSFAVSSDSTRMSLNGVYWDRRDGKVTLVATDGHRLGKAVSETEGDDWAEGVIIPPKTLSQVLKIAASDSPIDIELDENHVRFSTGNTQVISKLIEGPYPKYQNVIPENFDKTVLLSREDFANVLRSAAAAANSRTHQIKLRLDGDVVDVSTSNQDVGAEYKNQMACQFEGEGPFEVGFNAQYLQEVLRLSGSEQVLLKMNSPVGACIIEPVGEELDFFFLLMPLRLADEP